MMKLAVLVIDYPNRSSNHIAPKDAKSVLKEALFNVSMSTEKFPHEKMLSCYPEQSRNEASRRFNMPDSRKTFRSRLAPYSVQGGPYGSDLRLLQSRFVNLYRANEKDVSTPGPNDDDLLKSEEKKKGSQESAKEGAPGGEEKQQPPSIAPEPTQESTSLAIAPKGGEGGDSTRQPPSLIAAPTEDSTSIAIAPKQGEGSMMQPPSLVAAPTEDSTSLALAPQVACEGQTSARGETPSVVAAQTEEKAGAAVDMGKKTISTTSVTMGDDMRSKRDEIFSVLEEDIDLTKCLGDFDAESVEGVGASDRRTLDAAKKILKIAHKEKAIEKTLTKEENEIVSKFFSGKIPYDQNVLNVLDRVLDKTIDYLQTHGAHLDPETKRLID
ncbi:unnamed protein product, partial [Strongylus vulgaris]